MILVLISRRNDTILDIKFILNLEVNNKFTQDNVFRRIFTTNGDTKYKLIVKDL